MASLERPYCRHGGSLEIIQDVKALRQVIADRVATSGRSDASGIMWTTEMQKRPQINLFARARQSARLGCLMSSTQAPRKRLLDAGVSFATNANVAEYLGPGEVEIIQAEVEQHLKSCLRLGYRHWPRPQHDCDRKMDGQVVRAPGVRPAL